MSSKFFITFKRGVEMNKVDFDSLTDEQKEILMKIARRRAQKKYREKNADKIRLYQKRHLMKKAARLFESGEIDLLGIEMN